jgi:hypothetical protein
MPRRTPLSTFALAILLAAGVQTLILVVGVLIDKPLTRFFESPHPGSLRVHRSGRVVLQQLSGGFRSLSGQPLENAEVLSWLYEDDPRQPWLSGAWLSSRLTQRQRQLRLGWSSRLREVPGDPQASWFIVHSPIDDGHAYFVGYEVATKDLIGYLGQKGFRASLPPREEWFAMAGEPTRRLVANASGSRTPAGLPAIVSTPLLPPGLAFLASDNRVWAIILNSRSLHVLLESPAIVSLAAATTAEGDAELLARTSSEVIAIDFNGRRRASWKIPAAWESADFQWYELADGTALAQRQRQDGNVVYADLAWIAPDGAITRQEELEAYYGLTASAPVTYFLKAALTPSPLTMTYMTAISTPSGAVNRGEQPDFPTALAGTLADAWPALVTLYSLSALLAWLTYRRQVRYALPGAGAWAVFVFLLGVPGWLAYRWHRTWPVLEECGECRRRVSHDRETCSACGRLFGPAPLMGTEVFA